MLELVAILLVIVLVSVGNLSAFFVIWVGSLFVGFGGFVRCLFCLYGWWLFVWWLSFCW